MKILAVDDDPIVLDLLTEVLHAVGFSNLCLCDCAEKALAAIEQAEHPFELFLFDIQMPGMDGIALTSALRAMPQHATTPVLMITGMSDRPHIDAAFNAGANDYLTKPFEIAEIHARLNQTMSHTLANKARQDRNPVPTPKGPLSIVNQSDFAQALSFPKVDGIIDYATLENYLFQLSQKSMGSLRAFGIVAPNLERMFQASSLYEYETTMRDFAEAISDSLKPAPCFTAHAGHGAFLAVLTGTSAFNVAAFRVRLLAALDTMALQFCDGRPIRLCPIVGPLSRLALNPSNGTMADTLAPPLSAARTLAEAST